MGDAIFAASTFEDDRLGEMLIKAGKITVEQYDKSVEMLKKTKKRQGLILVELGYLTPKELFWGVKYQVKEIIHSMFQIEDGQYEFIEGDAPADEVIILKMSMGNLIYEGVKRIDNWTRIRNEMPFTDTVLKITNDPLILFQDIELTQQDRKIMSLIDGKKTIKEVIENSWLGSFDALKILYVLWSLGITEEASTISPQIPSIAESGVGSEMLSLNEILAPPTGEEETLLRKVNDLYSKLDKLTLAELLEVDETADNETIKRNYYRLSKEFHPDRYFNFADPNLKSKLTAIFDAVTKAYSTLKDEELNKEYFKTLSKTKAGPGESEKGRGQDHFKKGISEFKNGNYWGAVDHFKWATNLLPNNATAWSYMSLAYSKIPDKLKDAEEALLTAIKIEPFNSDFYANLGLIYIKAGLHKRASSNFQKALKIDPANEKAKKGLLQCSDRPA